MLMKIVLVIVMNSIIFNSFANSENVVTYEKMGKTKNVGEVFISNIHLKSDGQYYRIKATQLNKKRICKNFGFSTVGGMRTESDEHEVVVGVNHKFEISKILETEHNFILNLVCK